VPNSEEKIIYLQMTMTPYVQIRSKYSGVKDVNFAMPTKLAVKVIAIRNGICYQYLLFGRITV